MTVYSVRTLLNSNDRRAREVIFRGGATVSISLKIGTFELQLDGRDNNSTDDNSEHIDAVDICGKSSSPGSVA